MGKGCFEDGSDLHANLTYAMHMDELLARVEIDHNIIVKMC